MVLMLIFDHTVVSDIAALISGADDRYFFFKFNKRLNHGLVAFQIGKRDLDLSNSGQLGLALAVITESRRFEDSR